MILYYLVAYIQDGDLTVRDTDLVKKGEKLRNHGLNQLTVRERRFFFGFCDMYFEKSVILDLGQNY